MISLRLVCRSSVFAAALLAVTSWAPHSYGGAAFPTVTSGGTAGPISGGSATGDLIPSGNDLNFTSSMGAFFTPALGDNNKMVARSTVIATVNNGAGRKNLAAIYTVDGTGSTFLPAYQTGSATDEDGFSIDGVTYKSFLDPIISPSGRFAYVAKLTGPAAAGADVGVWTDLFTATGGDRRLLLRKKSGIPGFSQGETLKSVTSLSLRDGKLLALLTLASSPGVVSAANDSALVLITGPTTGQVLLREGTDLGGEIGATIKSFSILQPALGSPGQGRWQGDSGVVAKVTLVTKEVRIVKVALDGTVTKLLSTTSIGVVVSQGAQFKSFGLPAVDTAGGKYAVAATLLPLEGAITTKDDTVVLASSDGLQWSVLARENDPISMAPGAARFATFFDPVVNSSGRVAFVATLQGDGVTPKTKSALFTGTTAVQPLVRLGDQAPDTAGAAITGVTFTKFTSFALAPGATSGIILLAEVGGTGVTAKNKVRLYAQNAAGLLVERLQTGQAVFTGDVLLTKMTLLNALPGSFGATRSYNAQGSFCLLASFGNKTQQILRLDVQ